MIKRQLDHTFLPTSLRIHPTLLVSKISKGGESSSKLVAMDATPRLAHQKKSQFSVRNLGSPKSKSSKSIWKCGENGSVFWMLCGWHVTNGLSLNIHWSFNRKPPGRSQAKSSTTRRDLSTMRCGSPHRGCWRSWVANKDKASVAQWDEVSDSLTWLCLKTWRSPHPNSKHTYSATCSRRHHWSVFPHMARRFRRKVTQRLRSKAAPWEAFSWMEGSKLPLNDAWKKPTGLAGFGPLQICHCSAHLTGSLHVSNWIHLQW